MGVLRHNRRSREDMRWHLQVIGRACFSAFLGRRFVGSLVRVVNHFGLKGSQPVSKTCGLLAPPAFVCLDTPCEKHPTASSAGVPINTRGWRDKSIREESKFLACGLRRRLLTSWPHFFGQFSVSSAALTRKHNLERQQTSAGLH